MAISGKSFNHSARDAWELLQSTGVEALVAYDCSGAVLLMGTLLGGLITGVWALYKTDDRAVLVGSTAMLMGMILKQWLFLYSPRRSSRSGSSISRGPNMTGGCVSRMLRITSIPVE